MTDSDNSPFLELDATAVARSLSQIADREDDLAEVYFERREEIVLPPPDYSPGVLCRRDEGLAVRLVREGKTWLASRDGLQDGLLETALKQVARLVPSTSYPVPNIDIRPADDPSVPAELLDFPSLVNRAIRKRLAAFPLRLTVRFHRRWLRVVRPQLSPDPENESFFSCEADLPWARWGTLLPRLDEKAADRVARSLTSLFRSREAEPVVSGRRTVVLGSAACAVLLHELVAHALETDTLALGGRAEAALGAELGGGLLNVLDDPAGAPEGVRRQTDDEGTLVIRRWLLREGVVEQPLADLHAAQRSSALVPGAGRRSHRHEPPVPRSLHLELLSGDRSLTELLSDVAEGLFLTEVSRGSLDPLTGAFSLTASHGRLVVKGALADYVGPCCLKGRVAELLASLRAVSDDSEVAGAGWCAKSGVKLPVWATAPAIVLDSMEVEEW